MALENQPVSLINDLIFNGANWKLPGGEEDGTDGGFAFMSKVI